MLGGYNIINNQPDATYSLWYNIRRSCLLVTRSPASNFFERYAASCKHSLVLLRMGEIIAQNMLS